MVTMHIDDLTYKRDKKTYRRVLLRNSYRANGKVCHDTIANLSQCSDEEIIAIKHALKNKKDLSKLTNIKKGIETSQGLGVGAVWVLFQTAKRLGLNKILGSTKEAKLALWLIIATIIEQGSRLSATRLAKRHAACDILGIDNGFCEDDLYKAMDWFELKQRDIEDQLFHFRYGNKKPSFYLYDVTSSYFEGQQNELSEYGYNRDKKKGKKQIVIGLMTDDEGCPISIEVFQGNTLDQKTVHNQIQKMAERFGVEEVTLVGDRGMIKSAQVEELFTEKFHYITAITRAQVKNLINKEIIQLDMFDEKITEVVDKEVRYVFRRNPVRAEEIEETRQSKFNKLKKGTQKINDYLEKHQRANVKLAMEKIINKTKALRIDKWVIIKSENRKVLIEIDEQIKKEVSRLDGCYVLKTDLSKNQIDAKKVHDRYKDLAVVEYAFRTMKTSLLEMRPIYVRTANRTKAHVFTVMLSYMLVHHLSKQWKDVEATTKECIAELASICSVKINLPNFATCQTIPNPRELGKLLLEKAKITLPEAIPCRTKSIVHTRKKLIRKSKKL